MEKELNEMREELRTLGLTEKEVEKRVRKLLELNEAVEHLFDNNN
jgi:hypothetical protein